MGLVKVNLASVMFHQLCRKKNLHPQYKKYIFSNIVKYIIYYMHIHSIIDVDIFS
jgi:hypothetical protein